MSFARTNDAYQAWLSRAAVYSPPQTFGPSPIFHSAARDIYPQLLGHPSSDCDRNAQDSPQEAMDAVEAKTGLYLGQGGDSFRSPSSAGQMFSTFNSPSSTSATVAQHHQNHHRETSNGKAPSPEAQQPSSKKRKHVTVDEDLDSAAGHAGSFSSSGQAGNYAQHENPDLDSYIKSKRKPREKKACQVCRKRKVACDQQQPCLNCIERRYPELCVYEHSTDQPQAPPSRSDTGTTATLPAPHQAEQARNTAVSAALLTPAETSLGFSPEKISSGAGDTVTIPRDSFEKLISRLEHFQRSSSDLNAEIRGLINGASAGGGSSGENNAGGISLFSNNTSIASTLTAEPNPMTDGIHSKNELTGQTVHVGGNSVPAFVMQHSSHLEELLGTSVLPAFGLENESATYPFVSLGDLRQGRLSRVFDLCKTLPPEADIDRYFSSFRDISGVVYPAVANIEKFENDLFQFHIARAEALSQPIPGGIDEQSAYGKGLGWIGLLFATLASGCQCTDVSAKELDLASRVFVCCSFECLRMTNFLSNPSLENIQTLLVLGNVISNTMNAGVAWSLLGMTTRLAQVLGLHRPCRNTIPQQLKDERCKISWTMMWQESLLSITFDRAPASTSIFFTDHKGLPYDSYTPDGSFSYAGCMYQVTKVGLELLQDRRIPRNTNDMLLRMQHYEQQLRQIMGNASAHLKSSQHCQSLREQLQHWALYLHTSYIMSEVCREAIKPKIAQTELATTMRQTCLDSLTNTVRAFLGLNRLTAFASHSWSALSRGLSSALVLGILGHGEKNDEVYTLLNQLLMLLHEVMSRNSDGATELTAPIKRWIATLTRLTGGKSARQGSTTSNSTSPLADLDSDDSPYAQADSIIWGSTF